MTAVRTSPDLSPPSLRTLEADRENLDFRKLPFGSSNMSSILPFLHDILPMIIPTSIHITRAADLEPVQPVSPAYEASEEPEPQNPGPGPSSNPGTEPAGAVATLDIPKSNGHVEAAIVSTNAVVNRTDKMCAAGEPLPFDTFLPIRRLHLQ